MSDGDDNETSGGGGGGGRTTNKRTHPTHINCCGDTNARASIPAAMQHHAFPPSCARLAMMRPVALLLPPDLCPSRGDVTSGRLGDGGGAGGASGPLRD